MSKQDGISLSQEEIIEATGYARPSYQIKEFKRRGILATRRPDNTVFVLRRDVLYPNGTYAANDGPKLKSSRR